MLVAVTVERDKLIKELYDHFVKKGRKTWMIDGHTLRYEANRAYVEFAVEKGWIDLGELIEGDQWAWHEAKLTEEGQKVLDAWAEGDPTNG